VNGARQGRRLADRVDDFGFVTLFALRREAMEDCVASHETGAPVPENGIADESAYAHKSRSKDLRSKL
jgi:hypothetical protein